MVSFSIDRISGKSKIFMIKLINKILIAHSFIFYLLYSLNFIYQSFSKFFFEFLV